MIGRIQKLFEDQTSELYKRYDSTHPFDIYIGTNRKGLKSLAIVLDADREPIDSSRTISVDYYNREDGNIMISFGLEDNSLSDLFYRFCDDMIESLKNEVPTDGFLPIIKRWSTWIRFFSKANLALTENEVRGLIGEILFLRSSMLPKYGVSRSLEAFIGVGKAHKDFEIEDTWYEVKTIHNGARTAKISSIEQLDSSKDGFLEIVTLDQGTLGLDDYVTLNKIVSDFRSSLNDKNASIFDEKMRESGYVHDSRYDEYVYVVISMDEYRVKGGFPRIKKDTLPVGVVKANYDIDIATINKYRVSR